MPADSARPNSRDSAPSVAARTEVLARGAHRSSASFELALAPVLMALIGLWIDRTLGTTPWFIVILAALGVAGASVKVIYQYRHHMAAHDATAPWSADDTPTRLDSEPIA
jgi:F0F1-type ATP synthase assembly protein I